jgi:hypothetical protein
MSEQAEKKDLTQEELEGILKEQFRRSQQWEFFLMAAFIMIPIGFLLLVGISYTTLPLWFKIPFWIATGIAFLKCEDWIVERRIRKTVEALKAL